MLKVVGTALAALFLVPAIAFAFTRYAIPERGLPLAQFEMFSAAWQFILADRVAMWLLVAGIVTMLVILALGALAFYDRAMQYKSFVVGWHVLRLVAAVEMVLQGGLVVWLSFWLTAFFFHMYAIKLIAIAGIAVAVAVVIVVSHIFKRVPMGTAIEGELVTEADSPALWKRVRQLAQRMKTAPPDQIVAGIDTNFFVTQAPLSLGDRELKGRTLFISLPLLRVLDKAEADAVLGHELAHLRGGDTASSAALGPKLVQYDHYCAAMHEGAMTRPVYWMLRLYRVIFEMALKQESREREFKADRISAKLVSPQGIVQSLIKVAAYSHYRSQVEQQLFARDTQHRDALGISGQIASGLTPFATSAQFVEIMEQAHMPHPFDSHPPMHERMKNVGHVVDVDDFAGIVTRPTLDSWTTDISGADAIEQRLWSVYENAFAQQHEHSLAYRYEPANEEERAIVVKYFPPVAFELNKGKRILIDHTGMLAPGSEPTMSWDSVKDLKYENGIGGDVLQVTHPEKGWLGAKTTKIKLGGISKQRDQFQAVVGHYWQRHQVMRQSQVSAQS